MVTLTVMLITTSVGPGIVTGMTGQVMLSGQTSTDCVITSGVGIGGVAVCGMDTSSQTPVTVLTMLIRKLIHVGHGDHVRISSVKRFNRDGDRACRVFIRCVSVLVICSFSAREGSCPELFRMNSDRGPR